MDAEIRRQVQVVWDLRVCFTRGAFDPANETLANLLAGAGAKRHRALVAVDSGVLEATAGLAERITRYAERHRERIEFVAPPFVVRGGEVCKSDPTEVAELQALVERHHLCRQSFVVAIGGGAVLDAVGYAAATAHRGVRLIRMPTTVLAQNDAGVGVKNGVNAFGRKNFLGTFAPPFAIVNDLDFLATLGRRDLRSGIAEAVKVAAIKDRAFLDDLYRDRLRLSRFEREPMERMIYRCAELHVEHIAGNGDPFEFGSARPLDFGHWSAHKLEELTSGSIRHGEAVAIGIALDSLYAQRTGLLNDVELHKILATLEGIGFELYHWALHWMDVGAALREFQEHLGGELTLTLPQGLGRKVEVHKVDEVLLRACIDELGVRHQTRKEAGSDGRDDLPAVREGRG